MISKKVELKSAEKYGTEEKGLFARERISKDEVIAISEGPHYFAPNAMSLPDGVRDHGIQIGSTEYVDTDEIQRYTNHSCEPNAGFKDKVTLVAMRDIEPGEEITFDYEMSENSDWLMDCKCGTKSCRKKIGSYANMPESVKAKYGNYISPWLRGVE